MPPPPFLLRTRASLLGTPCTCSCAWGLWSVCVVCVSVFEGCARVGQGKALLTQAVCRHCSSLFHAPALAQFYPHPFLKVYENAGRRKPYVLYVLLINFSVPKRAPHAWSWAIFVAM